MICHAGYRGEVHHPKVCHEKRLSTFYDLGFSIVFKEFVKYVISSVGLFVQNLPNFLLKKFHKKDTKFLAFPSKLKH